MGAESPFQADAGTIYDVVLQGLNKEPLESHGCSDAAIDLISQMLSFVAGIRPQAKECRQHFWFTEERKLIRT